MNSKNARKGSRRIPPRLLVTGAAGFIGSRFVELALRQGVPLIATDLKRPGKEQPFDKRGFVLCDITSASQRRGLSRRLRGGYTLIHAAACVPRDPAREGEAAERIFAVNVAATDSLLRELKGHLSRVIYISTLEVYGAPERLPLREDSRLSPRTLYGVSKCAGEDLVRIHCRNNGIPCATLRFSSVYGPGEEYVRALPNFVRAAVAGETLRIYGDGSELRDYLYVDDACSAIMLAVRRKKEGIVNIASGKSISIRDAARIIVARAGSLSPVRFLPQHNPAYDIRFDISAARKQLGFLPTTTFVSGITQEIGYYRRKASLA